MGFLFFCWVCYTVLWVIQSVRVAEDCCRGGIGYRNLSIGQIVFTAGICWAFYIQVTKGVM